LLCDWWILVNAYPHDDDVNHVLTIIYASKNGILGDVRIT